MFRLWAKVWEKGRMVRDITIENGDLSLNRTKKIFLALEDACKAFDLSVPIWLDHNISEFQKVSKVRFHQDNFMEEIDFDYLELQVIEEDS